MWLAESTNALGKASKQHDCAWGNALVIQKVVFAVMKQQGLEDDHSAIGSIESSGCAKLPGRFLCNSFSAYFVRSKPLKAFFHYNDASSRTV